MRTVTRRYKVKTDIIRELMKENGLTQYETAELCGLSTGTVSTALSTREGTIDTIVKLADGLEVNPKKIAVFPRGKKRAAEADTPTAQVSIAHYNNNNDTISDSESKGGKLYMYDGALQDGKRLLELVPEETILEALVAHLQLPVAEVRWL